MADIFLVPFNPAKPQLWPALGTMPYIASISDSDQCYALIKEWLENCQAKHTCHPNTAVPLPTRLIEVGADDSIPQLVATNGQDGNYITLSYVWGQVSKGNTTKGNLQERLDNGISLNSLCKTHADAISITRKLGFKYLWIDALCIVQDDRQDWEAEAAQMCQIYRRASLTLAATSSKSGDDGIFSRRPFELLARYAIVCALKPTGDDKEADDDIIMLVSSQELDPNDPDDMIDTKLLVEDAEGYNGPFVLVRKPVLSHGVYFKAFHKYYTTESFPLETRAWCFQERLLSNRIVHFGKDELVWECNSAINCECGRHSQRRRPITAPNVPQAF